MSVSETARPAKRTAPDTHPYELQRLARQERTHPDFDPLLTQAHIWLFRAYNAVVSAHAEALRPIGLSPSAFTVLMALLNTPGNVLEPCQLAERLLVSRPSVTGLLDTLEAKGLVQRGPHPDDRRRVLVRLTDKARRLLDEHFPDHYSTQAELWSDFSADELADLVTLLRRVEGATPTHLLEPIAARAAS